MSRGQGRTESSGSYAPMLSAHQLARPQEPAETSCHAAGTEMVTSRTDMVLCSGISQSNYSSMESLGSAQVLGEEVHAFQGGSILLAPCSERAVCTCFLPSPDDSPDHCGRQQRGRRLLVPPPFSVSVSQLGRAALTLADGSVTWLSLLDEFPRKMEHGGLLAGFLLVILLPQVSPDHIRVEELEDSVFLSCNTSIKRMEGTEGILLAENKTLNLGKRVLDPRGKYSCETAGDSAKKVPDLQVYYRMCQNCVELDSATLAGIVITDIIATLLLALGVYCFSGHETGRLSGAADTQALLRNDQLYQTLQDRDDAQYSRIGGNWARNK